MVKTSSKLLQLRRPDDKPPDGDRKTQKAKRDYKGNKRKRTGGDD